MVSASSLARRRAARAVRWLTAAVLGGLAVLAAGTAAQAQPVTTPAGGRAPAPRAVAARGAPAPIPLNTAQWSGKAGFDSRTPAWYTDGAGIVHLQGAAKQTGGGLGSAVVGTLPPAARPANFLLTIVHTFNGTYANIQINPNGQILALPPAYPAVTDFSFVSLEGISYRPAHRGSLIAINTANWTGQAGGDTRPPAWYKDRSGVVHLQGAASQASATGTGANVIGTLPAAAAPSWTVYTVVIGYLDTYADVAIEPNGQIALIDPRPPADKGYEIVSLESISYKPNTLNNPIAVNTANWSGSAGFGSRGPAWFKDRSGVVHLEGAVTQTSPSGTGANLIGTLPAAAAPRHTVYTIVHTFNGTYADLAIEPNGQLDLIAPRSPMVQDYGFVSLESITYRR
jgi:hypothetical protein